MAVATSSISFGAPKAGPASAAEIHNQVTMMLGHEAFDPELSRRVLVDHAFIVAGGEITKQARNWIGNKLDASKRSQVMFMDRATNIKAAKTCQLLYERLQRVQ